MTILGIESSCDETAAAIVIDGYKLVSNVVATSMDLHAQYGGVIPEIAARSHLEVIVPVIRQTLAEASMTWDDIDGIAVTYGAGLGGSLLIGVLTARSLAITYDKPLYAINHVEAHVYSNFLTESALDGFVMRQTQPSFPMLAIIVSGGHSQLALFENHFDYVLLGQTQDDAIGEAFDKVAKITGLPYPGGPNISKAALDGDAYAYQFPKAKMSGEFDFSFSGIKTAVLRTAQQIIGEDHTFPSFDIAARLTQAQKNDIAASFQRTAIETIVDKARLAYERYAPNSVIIAGGVAANSELRRQLSTALPLPIEYPDIKLCTDNGAMVATLGCFKAMLKQLPVNARELEPAPNLSM